MNSKDFAQLLSLYDYDFPEELIAQEPASPRDSARLLVLDRKKKQTYHDSFRNLADYLPPKTVLVLNRTKVIPARLTLTKITGGEVKILCVDTHNGLVRVLCGKHLHKGARLLLKRKELFEMVEYDGQFALLRPLFSIATLPALLLKYGDMPLPPYIKHSTLSQAALREKYQAIFAKISGSVAAPTASLHFTERLLKELQRRGHTLKFVTLHVGLGTFAPLTEEKVNTGKLHAEKFQIDAVTAAFLNAAKKAGRPIIPVGTTALRALESAASAKGVVKAGAGETSLFIREGYKFRVANGLITNFHVPRSSLLMLVSALAGREQTLELYREAIAIRYRLFSFGDGMLIR